MAETVNLYDAKTNLSKLVDRAAAGEEIVIAKAGKPKAKLVPYDGPLKKRVVDRTCSASPIWPTIGTGRCRRTSRNISTARATRAVRLLLDTHMFLWWDRQPRGVSPPLRAAIAGRSNDIFVSAATVWEIAIKRARGKFAFAGADCRNGHSGSISNCCRSPARMPSMPDGCRSSRRSVRPHADRAGHAGRHGARHAGSDGATLRHPDARPRL